MAQHAAPFELLKTFPGIIHRQPLFTPDQLEVDSYHLSFLNFDGSPLQDDAPVPDFIAQLPAILQSLSQKQKALLTIPKSWQNALLDLPEANLSMSLTLAVHDTDLLPLENNAFGFASQAESGSSATHTATLLIDISQFEPDQLLACLPSWRQQHQILCATNVNSYPDYQFCKDQNLDLLQGMFYTLPETGNKQGISPSQQTLMELLVKLQEPDASPDDLAATINQDVSLSYKLLRLINSAFFGLPREVNSTKQALMLLGINKVKTWASMLCLSSMDDKPNELRHVAMVRARMCELLAKYYKGQSDTFFTAGLFSTLDAMMDHPLSLIIERLPLSVELKTALLDHKGPAGFALHDTLKYERGHWHKLLHSPIPKEVLVRTYLDSINWAKELNLQLQD
jgi:HDOD domain